LVKLPQGRYKVEASRSGIIQSRVVLIDPAKPQKQGWSWPEKQGETGS